MSARILLVEDEPGLVLTLSDLFRTEGYGVDVVSDGLVAVSKVRTIKPDVIVLDIMLPGKSGFDICQELRQNGVDTAILMLTARSEVDDRVRGLKLGADDYLIKPFDPSELLARVQALMRRIEKRQLVPVERFRFGDVEVDFERAEVYKAGGRVYLAGKELQLLRYFVDHRGKVIPREELLTEVWQYQESVSSRTVDVHVAWLRQKLETAPHAPQHFHTVRGTGYRFAV
jgi:two-component system, OmpR family, alkaline phosphatase synthesis response regulator PhoP